MKKILCLTLLSFCFFTASGFSEVFNNKLTDEERTKLENGETLIRNIDFYRNMCLDMEGNINAENLKEDIHTLSPKYLAEVIQYKPYEGNEDLPQKLRSLLYNVQDYAGIPYYSERKDKWYNLYEWARIDDEATEGNITSINATFCMKPFDIVEEFITIEEGKELIVYTATNKNKLRYLDKFDCVFPKKMKICIFLFRDGDNWILYGIGGVNAPRIPFFTERIEVSFINRIKTFCNFIFKQF